ncbi:MAG: hypothetical protein JJ869_06845 [Marivita sp.]|nr:hypothetical protein [Marivita sp.]
MGLPDDAGPMKNNGGLCALCHPLGAPGVRLAGTAMRNLARR